MMKYEVYSDRTKDVMSILVYCLFITGLVSLLVFIRPHIIAGALIILLIALLGWVIYQLIIKIKQHQLLYILDENGFTDLSITDQPLRINWTEVQKVELIFKESVLNISVVGIKPLSDVVSSTEDSRVINFNNTNEALYTVYISGVLFRRKTIDYIWTNLKKISLHHNPKIMVKEYEDSFTKNKK